MKVVRKLLLIRIGGRDILKLGIVSFWRERSGIGKLSTTSGRNKSRRISRSSSRYTRRLPLFISK